MDRKKMLRFEIKEKIGEGSFSINQIVIIGEVFKAFDNITNQEVALKVEKEDKNKKILKFEYDILQDLQGIDKF
jgi:predicted Ser/Thr protein kinase